MQSYVDGCYVCLFKKVDALWLLAMGLPFKHLSIFLAVLVTTCIQKPPLFSDHALGHVPAVVN